MNTQYNLCVTRLHIPTILPTPTAHWLTRIGREFDTVRELQNRLIPAPIKPVHGVECFAHCCRNRSDGAFFDLFKFRGNEVAGIIGNVGGEGIAGSILMTGIQASLRCMVRQGVTLRDAVTEINRILWELAPEAVHGTLLSARVDPIAHHLRYINAGHQAAIVIRRNRGTRRLEPNAAPLALSRTSSYRELRIRFDPGDIFIAASGEAGWEEACGMVTDSVAKAGSPRFRDLPRTIAETFPRTAGPIVIVISWQDPEEIRAERAPVRPLVEAAAA